MNSDRTRASRHRGDSAGKGGSSYEMVKKLMLMAGVMETRPGFKWTVSELQNELERRTGLKLGDRTLRRYMWLMDELGVAEVQGGRGRYDPTVAIWLGWLPPIE